MTAVARRYKGTRQRMGGVERAEPPGRRPVRGLCRTVDPARPKLSARSIPGGHQWLRAFAHADWFHGLRADILQSAANWPIDYVSFHPHHEKSRTTPRPWHRGAGHFHASYDPRHPFVLGESGCPAVPPEWAHALRYHEWTEYSQAGGSHGVRPTTSALASVRRSSPLSTTSASQHVVVVRPAAHEPAQTGGLQTAVVPRHAAHVNCCQRGETRGRSAFTQ